MEISITAIQVSIAAILLITVQFIVFVILTKRVVNNVRAEFAQYVENGLRDAHAKINRVADDVRSYNVVKQSNREG